MGKIMLKTNKININTDTFVKNLSNELDKIDKEVLTPDTVKITNLQIAIDPLKVNRLSSI